MKAEATRWIKECAYCSRLVEDRDTYFDLAPSGPVVYEPRNPDQRALPALQVICAECHEERLRFALGDFGGPVGDRNLAFEAWRAAACGN